MHLFCTICLLSIVGMINTSMASNVYMEYWLAANDLPYTDFNAPDPYCKVQIRLNGGPWEFEGETEISHKTQNPEWSKRFEVAYKTHTNEQKELLLKIYDKDYRVDDFLGEYTFKVTDLARLNGNKISNDYVFTWRDLYGAKQSSHSSKPAVAIAHRIYSIDGGRSSVSIIQPKFVIVLAFLMIYSSWSSCR